MPVGSRFKRGLLGGASSLAAGWSPTTLLIALSICAAYGCSSEGPILPLLIEHNPYVVKASPGRVAVG